METIFSRAAKVETFPTFSADTAWENLKTKLSHKEEKVIPLQRRRDQFYFVKIAASILLICVVGILIWRASRDKVDTVELVAAKTISPDTLPDGTSVVLNKSTTLAYTFEKKTKTRRVKLKGEAYFQIQESEAEFVVETDELQIRDIGTSFNVKSYDQANTVEVVVDHGEVLLYTKTDSLSVRANQKGVYDKVTKSFSLLEANPNASAYRSKNFVFSNTDLPQVIQDLNGVYNQKVQIDSALNNCRVTVSFNNEKIEDITEVIAETLDLTIAQRGDTIILKGNGCEN